MDSTGRYWPVRAGSVLPRFDRRLVSDGHKWPEAAVAISTTTLSLS